MIFWLLVTLGTASVVGYIWFASVRHFGTGVTGSHSATDLYKARIAEIDKDVIEGQLDEAGAKDARSEEGRRLLSVEGADAKADSDRSAGFAVAAFLALVPVISISVYMLLGNPQVFHDGDGDQAIVADGKNSIQELVTIAEQRLANHPDDVQGWKVLAPIYSRMGRFDDAQHAYREIIRIEGANAQNTLALAETLVRGDNGTVSPEAKNVFEEVLQFEANNPTANFMLGVFLLQQDRPREALNRWQSMVETATGNEEWFQAVEQRINQVRASLETPAEAIKNLPEQDQKQAIRGMVEGLAERLANDPSDRSGWVKLVRSLIVLGETEKASSAAARAIEVHGADANFVETIQAELRKAGLGE